MPGDEQKKKSKTMHALVGHYRHYRIYRCISRTTTRRGIHKIPKCFSCPGDCKELSKKTKRSTYEPGPSHGRPRTADLRQQLADHEADKDKRDTKCFSNLGDCRRLSKEARRWNTRNQGSSQLTVWQWLTRAHRGKLTSRPRIQKQTKQEDTKTLATIQNFRRRQERYRPKQTETQPTLQGPSSTTMWV